MMAKTSRQFKQQKQYTKDKGKEATEVTLKAYKDRTCMQVTDGATMATMTQRHIKQTHHL